MSDDPNKLRPGIVLDQATKNRLAKTEKERNVVWPSNRMFEEKFKWTEETGEMALNVTRPRSSKQD